MDRVDDLREQLAKYEQRLRNNEARIRTLIETIPLGLLIVSQSGKIESSSPTCLVLFRCGYSDLHQRDVSLLFDKPIPTSSEEAIELIANRRDGTTFPASVRVSSFAPAPTSTTNVPGVLLVVEDITAKRELERLRQEFVSMMTHDLRTPLTSIKMFLQMVGEGVFDDRPEKLKDRCSGLETETDRLLGMINSVLDLHKMEAGKLQLVAETLPVIAVVHQSIESVSSWAQTSGVSLDVNDIPIDLMVHCDRDYTVRVLINLISNAVKFSARGQNVRVEVRMANGFARVEVVDRGPGIQEEFKQRLFNRFEQARLSDARVKGGTGLGLAIAKAIVEEQGGRIGVESQLGEGCTFWFTLPTKVR